MSVLDIEFITAPPVLDRPLIYVYKSGLFTQRMASAYEKAVGAYREIRTIEGFDEVFSWVLPFLPAKAYLCSWNEVESDAERCLPLLLKHLTGSPSKPFALFVPWRSKPTKEPLWPNIRTSCLYIEETPVNKNTLLPILRVMEATTDLALTTSLITQHGFMESFQDLLQEKPDLSSVVQGFEERVLLAVDVETGKFDPTHYVRSDEQAVTHRVLRKLRTFVDDRSSLGWLQFFLSFNQLVSDRGWSSRRAVAELYGLTLKLVQRPIIVKKHRSVSDSVQFDDSPKWGELVEAVVLWALMLLGEESRLLEVSQEEAFVFRRAPKLFYPALDRLGQGLIDRTRAESLPDRMSGLWPSTCDTIDEVVRTLKAEQSDGTPTVGLLSRRREQLMEALLARLEQKAAQSASPWMSRLRDTLLRCGLPALLRMQEEDADPSPRPTKRARDEAFRVDEAKRGATIKAAQNDARPRWPIPHGWSEILGQPFAVAALRDRVRQQGTPNTSNNRTDREKGILIYGPAGFGKRTLARVYAKAAMCAAPRDGCACNVCSSCRQFDAQSHFDFTIFDAKAFGPDVFRDRISLDRYSYLSSRRVVVIYNIDAAPTECVDTLLKTLENPEKTNFVLLANDLDRVRPAVRSRCTTLRVRPLGLQDARSFVKGRVTCADRLDDGALVLLIAAAGGRPRRLIKLATRLVQAEAFELQKARTRLYLDWLPQMVTTWLHLFYGEADQLWSFAGSPLRIAREIRRARLFCHYMYLRSNGVRLETCSELDPVFLYIDQVLFDDLDAAARVCADRRGWSPAKLWLEASDVWCSADVCNFEGFLGAVDRSMSLLGTLESAD